MEQDKFDLLERNCKNLIQSYIKYANNLTELNVRAIKHYNKIFSDASTIVNSVKANLGEDVAEGVLKKIEVVQGYFNKDCVKFELTNEILNKSVSSKKVNENKNLKASEKLNICRNLMENSVKHLDRVLQTYVVLPLCLEQLKTVHNELKESNKNETPVRIDDSIVLPREPYFKSKK